MVLCLLVARDLRDLGKGAGFPGTILILTLTAPQFWGQWTACCLSLHRNPASSCLELRPHAYLV